jgi:transcriptional regulator with XRE-family HTH domain
MQKKSQVPFGRRLQRLMEDRQLSNSDLAAKMWGRYTNSEGKNVARGRDRISVWVNGHNFPSAENLEKLAKALDVKISELEPEAELKAAYRGAVDYSFTQPTGDGRVFVQIAQFVSAETAHAIHGVLLKDTTATN